MKKKEKKVKKPKKEKPQKKTKDFIPSQFLDSIREMKPIDDEENIDDDNLYINKEYKPTSIPFKIPEEWKYNSEEEINNEIFNDENNNYDLFIDPENEELLDNLPLYFLDIFNDQLNWNRPNFYISNYYLIEKIKILFPKRNYYNVSNEIRSYYLKYLEDIQNGIQNENEEEEFIQFLGKDDNLLKKKIYKDFYPILSQEYKYYICNYSSRYENDEEYELRIEKEKKEEKKQKKTKKKSIIQEDKKEIREIIQSNLEFSTNPQVKNSFYTWLTSIYQLIFDLNLNDINTKKSFLYNIYPQENGIPIYNPKGKYIIKLYLMGKPRKIIIDDQIPFNKDNDFIFPKCKNIEELWPALFTKALMKLNMYKVKHPQYFKKEEFDDISLIYNLTGKFVSSYNINDFNIFNLFDKEFPLINKEHKFYFGIYNQINTKTMKNKISYNSYDERKNELNKQNKIFELNKPIIPLIQNLRNYSPKKRKTKFKEFLESRHITIRSKSKDETINENSEDFQRNSKKTMTIFCNRIGNLKQNTKTENLINNNLIDNFIYTITDYFNSKDFNMKRTQNLHIEDLIKESELSKKQYKKIKPDERREYSISRKKMMLRHLKEKNLRMEDLKKNKNNIQLFKLFNGCENIPIFDSDNEYTEKEIFECKKCLINNWKFPPIEYFNFSDDEKEKEEVKEDINVKIKEVEEKKEEEKKEKEKVKKKGKEEIKEKEEKKEEKEEFKEEIKNEEKEEFKEEIKNEEKEGKKKKSKNKIYKFIKEDYIQICGDDLLKESELNKVNIINPQENNNIGNWINLETINNHFNKILLIIDEDSFYQNELYCDNNFYKYNSDLFELNEENKTFYLSSENIIEKEKEYSLIINFQPYIEDFNYSKSKEYLAPYITLDIYKINPMTLIKEKICLNYIYSCYFDDKLKGDSDYLICIKNGYFPVGFIIQIFSNGFEIENMNFNDLFQNLFYYEEQNFTIDFPSIVKNNFWLLGRFSIEKNANGIERKKQKEEKNKNDKKEKKGKKDKKGNKNKDNIKKNINKDNTENKTNNNDNIENNNEIETKIDYKPNEIKFKINIKFPINSIIPFINIYLQNSKEIKTRKIMSNDEFINLTLEENIKYYIILSIKPEYSLNSDSLNVTILYNNLNYSFELSDDLNPYFIEDKCAENKGNGLIFSEYIYPSEIDVLSTIVINIKNNIDGNNDDIFQNNEIRLNLELYQLTDEPNDDFNTNSIIFSYSDLGQLLYKWDFYKDIVIINIPFHYTKTIKQEKQITEENNNIEKKKKENKSKKNQEIILPYLLICYMEDRKIYENIDLSNINWKITIFTNNLICFIKNNSKINHENKLKLNWEEEQNGRALKANHSRKYFLISLKKNKGEELSTEEENILNNEKRRHYSIDEKDLQNLDKKVNMTGIKNKKVLKKVSKLMNKIKKNEKNNNEESSYSFLSTLAINNNFNKKKVFSMKNILLKKNDDIYENPKNNLIRHYLDSLQNKKPYLINKSGILPEIMNKEKFEQKKEMILSSFEESEQNNKNNIICKKIDDEERNNLYKKFNFSCMKSRMKKNKSCEDLMGQRARINSIFLDKIQYHKKIKNILNDNKSNINHKISLFEEAKDKLNNDDNYLMDLFLNISSIKENMLIEEISNKKKKNNNNIMKIIEEIKLNHWKISENVLQEATNIINSK